MTGVSSGIGLEQAKAFLQAGAIVYGADIKESAEIKEVEQKFPTLSFQQVDIRKKKDIHMWTEKIKKELSTVDILLNTAGILDNYAPTLDTSEHGVIVNMASIAGLVAGGGGAAYTAAKHGIIGYTKQLAYDYADKGIRVNCIAPGAINTPMNAADFAGDGAMAKEVARLTPAKRWAKPKEVAEMTLYLMVDGQLNRFEKIVIDHESIAVFFIIETELFDKKIKICPLIRLKIKVYNLGER